VASFTAPGLYGKLPAQADFVRLQAADAVARPFVLWLEEASETARRSGIQVDAEPVRFLFRPAGASRALVGVMAWSSDRVGRNFPLALFSQVAGSDLGAVFPAVPQAASAFLGAAAALAREAATLSAADLSARVEALPLPGPAELAAASTALAERARDERGRDFLSRLFGSAGPGQHAYALHCFRSACQPARGKEPARAAAVLDCPVRADLDRWAWLELGRRGLGWSVPPSFFWWAQPESRLLLSVGPVPASVFGVLWDPGAKDARVWPLVTDRPAAIESAHRALGKPLVDSLGREDLSLADLLARVMP
jgi:type VI secretion system protein ImpM